MSKFEKNPHGKNHLANGEGFFVSFNGHASELGVFSGNADSETALCAEGQYFILNGDFRQDYERLIPDGLNVCLQYFLDSKASVSPWSNDKASAKRLLQAASVVDTALANAEGK